MTRIRWLIVLFWVFIGVMLIRQFYAYNGKLEKESDENSPSKHYFITLPPSSKSEPSGTKSDAHVADVRQISFLTKANTPATGSFTAYVTLKNQGVAKAVGVQVLVRPYRGIIIGGVDEKMATVSPHPLSENDPLSQFGEWVACPDLAPGETCTESVIFINQPHFSPGLNPHPQITFETAKVNP